MSQRLLRIATIFGVLVLLAAGCVWRIPVGDSVNEFNYYDNDCFLDEYSNGFLSGDGQFVIKSFKTSSGCYEGEDYSSSTTWTLETTDGQMVSTGPGYASVSDGGSAVVFAVERPYPSELTDVVLRDIAAGQDTVISVGVGGEVADGSSSSPSISADGSTVVFTSEATNLVVNGTTTSDVYRYDVASGTIELVTTATNGGATDGASGGASVSGDGRVVAFTSRATNLVATDGNGESDVFVADGGSISKRSNAVGGGDTDGYAGGVVLSRDGSTVVFNSNASNLITNDPSADYDLYAAGSNGIAELVSIGVAGQPLTGAYRPGSPSVSADGSLVLFSHSKVPREPYPFGTYVPLLRDRTAGITEAVPTSKSGPNVALRNVASLSADGRYALTSSFTINALSENGSDIDITYELQAAQDVRIDDISPSAAAVGTSTPVVITGFGFQDGASVVLEAAPNGVSFTDVDVLDRTTLTATMNIDSSTQPRSYQLWILTPHPASSGRTGPSSVDVCNCLTITP